MTGRLTDARGVTLLELTMAVAIFTVAVGAAAQSLISFYTTMDMQNQRVIAINHCRGILSEMRNLRDTAPNTTANPTHFQTTVLEHFAEGSEQAGPALLKSSVVTVTYEDTNPSTNPLVPTVTIQWLDLKGHLCTARMSTALTDR